MKNKIQNVTAPVTHVCYTETKDQGKEGEILNMQSRMCGNEYRTIVACVDSYEGKVLRGRLYNAALHEAAPFANLMQFLLQVESLLEQLQFPQSFDTSRTFSRPAAKPVETGGLPGSRDGACATVRIRILFRQNASWQGTVSWLEGGQEEGFRSVLELVKLMDSALPSDAGAGIETNDPS